MIFSNLSAKSALWPSGTFFALAAVSYRGAALAQSETSTLVGAANTLVWAQAVQVMMLGGWLLIRNPAVIGRVLRAWRVSLLAGFMGAAASGGWFFAFAIEPVAHVRTLGLVEVLFSMALSRQFFSERLRRTELVGIALLTLGLVVITLAR